MKNKDTDIVFVLDRSGSMSVIEDETIKGYNDFLKKEKNSQDNVYVTTVLFDDKYELLYSRENINEVKKLTNKEYYARGCTALMDAIGKTRHRTTSINNKYNISSFTFFNFFHYISSFVI